VSEHFALDPEGELPEPGPLTSSGPGMLPVGSHEATRRATRRRRSGHCRRGVAFCNFRLGESLKGAARARRGCPPGSPPTLATRVRAGDPRCRRRPFTPRLTSSSSSDSREDPGRSPAPPGPGRSRRTPGASASAAGLQRGPRHHHDDSARPLRALAHGAAWHCHHDPAHGARHAQGVAEAKPQSAADSCNSRCMAR
jgi:hypothetical protein